MAAIEPQLEKLSLNQNGDSMDTYSMRKALCAQLYERKIVIELTSRFCDRAGRSREQSIIPFYGLLSLPETQWHFQVREQLLADLGDSWKVERTRGIHTFLLAQWKRTGSFWETPRALEGSWEAWNFGQTGFHDRKAPQRGLLWSESQERVQSKLRLDS